MWQLQGSSTTRALHLHRPASARFFEDAALAETSWRLRGGDLEDLSIRSTSMQWVQLQHGGVTWDR